MTKRTHGEDQEGKERNIEKMDSRVRGNDRGRIEYARE